ncbi:hypothetical protein PCY12_09715, partial [Streptococcus sp. SPS1]|uniref:hypothetical protein n=1 Tax=Streptococcus sp. SPS1 TaxID=3018247 RepID=UPI00263C6ED8
LSKRKGDRTEETVLTPKLKKFQLQYSTGSDFLRFFTVFFQIKSHLRFHVQLEIRMNLLIQNTKMENRLSTRIMLVQQLGSMTNPLIVLMLKTENVVQEQHMVKIWMLGWTI